MIKFVIFILIFAIFLMMIGFVKAKSLQERILFGNSITNICIIIIAILSSFGNRESYIDIAIIYSLISFLAMQALMKYYNNLN